MSAPRRRRWMDVLRRTAGVGEGSRRPTAALDDAAIWGAQEQAKKALVEAETRAERVAASLARQRALIEGAGERANLLAARSEGLGVTAARVAEAFERLGVVALNAGLEGARVAEPQGRALLLLSEEIRANVVRGSDAAKHLSDVAAELSTEAGEVRRQLERSRAEVGDVGQEAAHLRAAATDASKALDEVARRLRKATGIDPETARAVAMATEHARGLMTALSTLTSAPAGGDGRDDLPTAPVLGALRPVIAPLVRLLGELDDRTEDDDGKGDGS